ncbi:MAG: DUF2069 domain-containing protein, partial [Parahaliea sp.]
SVSRRGASLASWYLVWAGWGLLLVQQVLDAWSHAMPWVIWLGKLLPLLLFLPGMLRDRLRSYVWLCFVSLLYFIALVERLFATPGHPLAIAGMLAVVTLFCAGTLYVRWRARELRASLASGDDG